MNGQWLGKSSIKQTQQKVRVEHGKPGKETSLNFHDSSYIRSNRMSRINNV